jgi:transcriptional regulator with XRE-family HTH domain
MVEMAPRRETVGQRVRRLRLAADLTQRQLAEGLDRVGYAFISRIEADARRPSDRTIRQLAARLGVTPLELETGDPDAPCPHCGRSAC